MVRKYPAIAALLLLFIFSGIAPAQNVLTSYSIFDLRQVTEVEVSPDGKFAAYVVTLPRSFSDGAGSDYRELYVCEIPSGKTTPLVTGKNMVSTPHWSRDGKVIGFLAKIDTMKTVQLFEIPPTGGKPEKITSHPTPVYNFEYSRDGKLAGFTATEPDASDPDKLKAKGFNAQIYEEEWVPVNLYILDRSTRQSRKLTKNITVHNFDWYPDGSAIAAAVTQKNLTDHEYMYSRIYAIDTQTGLAEKFIENPGKLGHVEWSPDGKHIAFLSAVDVTDSKEGSIFVTETENNSLFQSMRNLNKDFAGTVTAFHWKDNNTIIYVSEEGVDITIREQKIDGNDRPLLLQPGKAAFTAMSIGGGIIAVNGNTSQHPSELYTLDPATGAFTRRTNHNEWLSNIQLARQEEIRYYAKDSLLITGILIYPLGYDNDKEDPKMKNKVYPLIVNIHGGPEACFQNGWLTSYGNWGQVAAAEGFFVFHPNYRASTGRGVEYLKLGYGDLVGKEFEDVLDGIDYLIAKGYVDRDRVGIGGGSYGGYFSAWAATKYSSRFAASCVFVGISNQISKRNTTDIPLEDYYVHWGYWTEEKWMDVLQRSPVYWAKGSQTPTLILHGKEDPRIPPSQGLELYRVLKQHQNDRVRLVYYPGEGHGNRNNPARLDFSLRTMEWFKYYLTGPTKKKWEIPSKELKLDLTKLK